MSLYEVIEPPEGMVRKPDHQTSKIAAAKVQRVTLRQTVVRFALAAASSGFTDDDLKADYPGTPESSLRKRRTELAQENIIAETGFLKLNRHGSYEKVWMHRDFHPNPPPIIERDTEPKQSKAARLHAEVLKLLDQVDRLEEENGRLRGVLRSHNIQD